MSERCYDCGDAPVPWRYSPGDTMCKRCQWKGGTHVTVEVDPDRLEQLLQRYVVPAMAIEITRAVFDGRCRLDFDWFRDLAHAQETKSNDFVIGSGPSTIVDGRYSRSSE